MKTARTVLRDVETRGGLNILLTAAPLCAAYAKICVFGFGRFFSADRVYSAKEDLSGKTNTMDQATREAERSEGAPCRFLSCGDGKAEAKAATKLRLPHIHVAGAQALQRVLDHL